MESLAYEFNSKNNCAKLLDDTAIEKKYFGKDLTAGLDARREVREDFDAKAKETEEIQKQINSVTDQILVLTNQVSPLQQLKNNFPDNITKEQDEEREALQNEIERLELERDELKKQKVEVEKESRVSLRAEQRTEAYRARKDNHPYFQEARRLAIEEIKTQDTLLSNLVDLETFLATGELNLNKAQQADPKDLIDRMTLCNFKSLTINALRCLFSGVSQEPAFKKIAESAMRAMDIDVFGIFIQNLPPAEQAKIRKLIRDEWADMPMPWEEGFKGGSTEDANPYLNYLGTNRNQGVEAKRAELSLKLEELGQEIIKSFR
jgi:hypothetical protein